MSLAEFKFGILYQEPCYVITLPRFCLPTVRYGELGVLSCMQCVPLELSLPIQWSGIILGLRPLQPIPVPLIVSCPSTFTHGEKVD